MSSKQKPGTIGWHDPTVTDAERIRDLYARVAGWEPEPVAMDGYSDFNMSVEGTPVAGVCHARGVNAGIPAQWMMYPVVEDLEAALAEVERGGGAVVHDRRAPGAGGLAVIKDPAGAFCSRYQA